MSSDRKLVNYRGRQVVEGWPEKIKIAQEFPRCKIGGKSLVRVAYGSEAWWDDGSIPSSECHDCGVTIGQFHVPGCMVERCPSCAKQAATCDCDEEGQADKLIDHGAKATAAFAEKREGLLRFAETLEHIVTRMLLSASVTYHSAVARVKTLESFKIKASQPSELNQDQPKYGDPMRDITDVVGLRITVFVPEVATQVERLLDEQFHVVEKSDKSEALIEEGKFGYSSIHYLVKLSDQRISLPEYREFGALVAEIQVRTVLQHAWAEISHEIQYKSSSVMPTDLKRRFTALAAVLEMADREFQAILNDDAIARDRAAQLISDGKLASVEITPDTVKRFLESAFGTDRRVGWETYDYVAQLLRALGFDDLAEVDNAIAGYDGDQISRLLFKRKLSPQWRLQCCLLASMGDHFIERHFLSKFPEQVEYLKGLSSELKASNIVPKS